jgi:hypothetical protein
VDPSALGRALAKKVRAARVPLCMRGGLTLWCRDRYHYKLDSHAMHALLQSRFPTCTPSFVQTGRSTFVEHHLTYNVIQAPDGPPLRVR